MNEKEPLNVIALLKQYFENYNILLFCCSHLTRQSWSYINIDKMHLHAISYNINIYNVLIAEIEEKLLNDNENLNQRLFNLITTKINHVNQLIFELEFINTNKEINNKSLDFLRFEGGTFFMFIMDFLAPSANVHMNLTIGKFFNVIVNKFEKDKSNITDLFALKILPFTKEENRDQLPEYEYKNEVQKIAWLHETGVLETIINNTKDNGAINWTRAANVINSFTQINVDTIRKCLMAIYTGNETNKKNNPLNNPANNLFVKDMAAKFKLNKPS